MRVRLLGTASADGWPNPFCDCTSCSSARRSGSLRAPTGVLVDRSLLLDCTARLPAVEGLDATGLADVSHIMLTGGSSDGGVPSALLARSWAGAPSPVVVAGPAGALDRWRRLDDPDDPVTWHAVQAGDVMRTDDHTIRVLEVSAEAVAYDVTDARGCRMLYTPDAGPLTSAALHAVADARFQLALLDPSMADQPGRLRAVGALDDRSQVVAVHLSHHCPNDLAARCEARGVKLVDDGWHTDLATAPMVLDLTRLDAGDGDSRRTT